MNKDKLLNVKSFFLKMNQFYMESMEYLKPYQLNDETMLSITNTANALIHQNRIESSNAKYLILSGKMLNFRPANEELLKSSIGFIDILEPSMDSKILHNRDLIMDLMILCNFDFNSIWQSEYRASVNGFECSNYNYKCCNKQPLLIIIKYTNDYIFGEYMDTNNQFIFSLINHISKPLLFSNTRKKTPKRNLGIGINFKLDLQISNNSNNNSLSRCNLGYSFRSSQLNEPYGSL